MNPEEKRAAVTEEAESTLSVGSIPALVDYDPFFEISLDLLCIAGTDGYFKKINPAFGRILGYPDEEMLSRPFLDFVHPDDLESTLREIQHLGVGLPAVMFENRYLAADGSIRWLQWNASSRGTDGLIFAVARDISASKTTEEDLRRYAGKLEESNRQLKSTQDQLIQAEKMESIGRLAAGVAHEVKNPLGLLKLGIDYLTNHVETTDPAVPQVLSEMTSAIGRASTIINGLLNFSVENRIKFQALDFRPLVEGVLAMMRHELTQKKVRVDLRVQKDLPPVSGDTVRLQQVLINLITNAIHAMEKTAEPRLKIRARLRTVRDLERDEGARTFDHLRDGDDTIVVEVIDNGSGIPAKASARLFDPFFTTKATGIGTGLGLTVVRSIIDLHGGQVEIVNDPGTGGARVTMTLKAAKDSPGTDSSTGESHTVPEAG